MGFFDKFKSKKKQNSEEPVNKELNAVVSKIFGTGFEPTARHMFGKVVIWIDENKNEWLVMHCDYPSHYKMHPIAAIESVRTIKKSSRAGSSARVHLGNGLSIGGFDSSSYYTQCGVQVLLNDINHPSVYIDCMDSTGYVEQIVALMRVLKKQATVIRNSMKKNGKPDINNFIEKDEPQEPIDHSSFPGYNAAMENLEKIASEVRESNKQYELSKKEKDYNATIDYMEPIVSPEDGISSADEHMNFSILVMNTAFIDNEICVSRAAEVTKLNDNDARDILDDLTKNRVLKMDDSGKYCPIITKEEWYEKVYKFYEPVK